MNNVYIAYALLAFAILGVFLLAKQAQDEARRRHNVECSNHVYMVKYLDNLKMGHDYLHKHTRTQLDLIMVALGNRVDLTSAAELEATRQALDILTSETDRRFNTVDSRVAQIHADLQRIGADVSLTQRAVGHGVNVNTVHQGKAATALTIIAEKLGIDVSGE